MCSAALSPSPSSPGPAPAEDVQDCLRLAESLDEAMREGARLRAFLVADLARYRAALPGTTAGYLVLLEEALAAGYRPEPDDLAALRALRGNPAASALLGRCRMLAEQDVRARLARGDDPPGRPDRPRRPQRASWPFPAALGGTVADPPRAPSGIPPGSPRRARPEAGRPRRPPPRRPETRPPHPHPGRGLPRRKPAPPPAPTRPSTSPRAETPEPPEPPSPAPSARAARGYPGHMDYVSALVPPIVMAVFFIGVIRVIVKTQGGANKAKEDAAVDAALARTEGARPGSAKADA